MRQNSDGYWQFMFFAPLIVLGLGGAMIFVVGTRSSAWQDGFSEGYQYGLKTHDTPEDPDVALVRWNKDK